MNNYWKWVAIGLLVALIVTLLVTLAIVQGVMDFGLAFL